MIRVDMENLGFDSINKYAIGDESKGFADIAFIPKRSSNKPAMIVELKWNRDADTAIAQIHSRNYAGKLAAYGGDMLLVGIDYDKDKKEYRCRIERTEA